MSFRLYEKYSSQYSKVGDRPALGNADTTQSNEKQYNSYSDVMFNLKDIDPAKTALGVLPHPKNMQVISLQTHNDQKLVSVNRKSDDIRFGGKENQGSILFPVKDPSGQLIGQALKRAAFLCQPPK